MSRSSSGRPGCRAIPPPVIKRLGVPITGISDIAPKAAGYTNRSWKDWSETDT
ncbi:unnamed protein product [Ilex paraguariensis]|uniref:Uncharacterized protein n=1 Tax=Ilex paraguariensis TaxID=185542 RepID=A0ABC8UAN9_9AQUA